MIKFVEQGPLSAAIAEEFFGWKWMAWVDCPTRDHPDYPTACRVRQFMSPESLKNARWKVFWSDKELAEATGEEPLSYSYCSSMGPSVYPSYASDLNDCRLVEKEICKRKLWDEYWGQLATQCGAWLKRGGINSRKMHFATAEQRCIAALAVVGSKYVRSETVDKAATVGED